MALGTTIKNSLLFCIQIIVRYSAFFYLLGFLILGYYGYRYFTKDKETTTMDYNTDLIQERIKNVGKLIVTEGHFSQVMTYKDQQKYLMDLISFEKKAIIIINADVTISYDLRQMKYAIDDKNKVITILTIPKEEVKISPDIQFYNVEQSTMNAFTGDDYNKINKKVKADLANKVAKSKLKANAKNRLISELSTILVLTHSMGWKLQYEDQIISTDKEIDTKIKL
jgi:lipopolysaccharide export LptBFGC system permease protein LptF